VVAVNKMDLVGFSEDVFREIRAEFCAFAGRIGDPPDLEFIPVSALCGDNVVTRSTRMPWYGGPALLDHLETVPLATENHAVGLRLPVQYVIRPHQDFRGLAGQLASGAIHPGDPVVVLPSGRQTRVRSIVAREGELAEAFAPMSVTVCLDDEIDVSRGDMLVAPDDQPARAERFEATLVWMNEKPAVADRPYLLKHTTQTLAARIIEIRHRIDIHTLEAQAAGTLRLNEIGRVLVEAQRPLFVDPYRCNRATGSFILLDRLTNETLGAGTIESAAIKTIFTTEAQRHREEQNQKQNPRAQRRRRSRRGEVSGGPVAQSSDDAPRSASIRIADNPDVLWLLARRLVENGHRVVVLSSQLLQVGNNSGASTVELSFTRANLADQSALAVDEILQELAHCGVSAQN